jgi:hypothetical protein
MHEPSDTPVTRPEVALTLAIPVLLLIHEPPPVPSLNGVVPLTVTVVVPLIDEGDGLTVIVSIT